MRLVKNDCTQLCACGEMPVGAGGELCQMLFGNLEGWRLFVF